MQPEREQLGFFSRTTFHGFSYVVATSVILGKLFWCLTIAVAFSMATYYTVQVATDYVNAPVSITVSSEKIGQLELPDLVLCPVRGLNASKLVADQMPLHIVDAIMKEFAVDVDWLPHANEPQSPVTSNKLLKDWMKLNNVKDFMHLVMKYSYEPSEFIHSMSTGFSTTTNESNLTDKLFGKKVGYANGICFTYATNNSISWPGMKSGYTLILKLPARTEFDNSFTDGWYLGFTKPLKAPPSSYIRILKNSAVDIELSKAEIERFPRYSWPRSGLLCKDSPKYTSAVMTNCHDRKARTKLITL